MKVWAYAAISILLTAPIWEANAAPRANASQQASLELGNNERDQATLQYLQQFQKNALEAQKQKVTKYTIDGKVAKQVNKKLAGISKQSDAFIVANAKKRKKFCTKDQNGNKTCLYEGSIEKMEDVLANGRRAIDGNDQAEDLVDNGSVERGANRFRANVLEMAQENMTSGKVAVQPWSSDYWPIATGITARRYMDKDFPEMEDGWGWHKVNKYWNTWFNENGANAEAFMDVLSPAEKYDLLMGDPNFTLTREQINEGRNYAFDGNTAQKVETWMGICHGWAPAAYMESRPTSVVSAFSPSGIEVRFYPDDIKALSVLRWANGETVMPNGENANRFVGGRCDLKANQLKYDRASGAVINDDCFDTNPGTLHETLVNQIGLNKRSFVIDATFDAEVWNQPVVSYSYTYFNPRTMKQTRDINQAIVPYDSNADKFRNVRLKKYGNNESPDSIVGVIMQMTYVAETDPDGEETDNPGRDNLTTVNYTYDLELATNGDILGGEWYSKDHPDFLWTPAKGAIAWTNYDRQVGNYSYDPSTQLSQKVANVGIAAAKQGYPLKAVIDGLVAASAKK